MTPEEEFKKRVSELPDWRGQIFSRLREVIESADPELKLVWKWGTAVWEKNGQVCAIGAFSKGVKVNFFKGALIEDKDNVYNNGVGKKMRSIDIFEGEKIPEKAITNLVKEAVKLNQ